MHKLLLRGEIDVNCYFIEHNKKCYIVDPGYERERIIKYVEDNNLEVMGILLTHGHYDHVGAIDCFDVPVYIHKTEYSFLKTDEINGFKSHNKLKPYSVDDLNIVKIEDSDVIEFDDKKIEVIHTPGHTAGCVCYKFENDLFSGDTLFKEAVGRFDFPTGDLNALKKSVVNLIDSLDDDVNVHPGHMDSSTIKYEKENNDYYLEWKVSL
ncbi:MBL fold metallo-hydrolase [Clostridium sediminicola]|uniref:MBL fold metallo-hydrolase n=1 Tax=Clostridium sediminicola TaxID=3114879 RepID=UPI0031F26C22